MLKIPYGNTYIEFNEGSANVLTSSIDTLRSSGSGSDIVRRAMLRPIDSPRLSELARGKKNCVIIISALSMTGKIVYNRIKQNAHQGVTNDETI